MEEYDIYGVGAALVDTEVEVANSFLSDLKVKKGVMTLVDEHRQRELLDMFKSRGYILVRNCGGSVCNSLVAAARLGSRAFFSGKVANDSDGEFFVSDLRGAGVDFSSPDPERGVTGKCLVMVTDDAERTMNTFLGVSEALSVREMDYMALSVSKWFYVEGYLVTDAMRTQAVIDAVNFARLNGVKIALSLSDPFVASLFGDPLRKIIGEGVDLIFCNKDEAKAFTSSSSMDKAVKKLKNYASTFAITDGADGALIFDGDQLSRIPGSKVLAIDTNGAGDMFAGAFLNRIICGSTHIEAAKVANSCASRVVAKFGPRLDYNDFNEIKVEFGF
mgnify:CR=1 FL=1